MDEISRPSHVNTGNTIDSSAVSKINKVLSSGSTTSITYIKDGISWPKNGYWIDFGSITLPGNTDLTEGIPINNDVLIQKLNTKLTFTEREYVKKSFSAGSKVVSDNTVTYQKPRVYLLINFIVGNKNYLKVLWLKNCDIKYKKAKDNTDIEPKFIVSDNLSFSLVNAIFPKKYTKFYIKGNKKESYVFKGRPVKIKTDNDTETWYEVVSVSQLKNTTLNDSNVSRSIALKNSLKKGGVNVAAANAITRAAKSGLFNVTTKANVLNVIEKNYLTSIGYKVEETENSTKISWV